MEDIYYKKDVSTTYDNLCYTYSMDSSRRLSVISEGIFDVILIWF